MQNYLNGIAKDGLTDGLFIKEENGLLRSVVVRACT